MGLQETGEPPLWRSMMIVPVNVEKFVAKAHARGADAIILDLEDSITPDEKSAARGLVADAARRCAAGGSDILVRINRPLELAVRDIEAAVSPEVAALMVPKVESGAHVRLLAELLDTVEAERGIAPGHTRMAVLIETAEAFWRMKQIAAAHERVVAISLGSEDFSFATNSEPAPDVLLYPKQQMLLAAYAAGIIPLGVIGSIADFQDLPAYREAIGRSRRFGFQGASCIHPSVVPLLNEGFSPSHEEMAAAERIVAGFAAAKAAGRGAVTVDGKMVDIPVVRRAERVLKTARRIAERARRNAAA